jgi:hypothetical protein
LVDLVDLAEYAVLSVVPREMRGHTPLPRAVTVLRDELLPVRVVLSHYYRGCLPALSLVECRIVYRTRLADGLLISLGIGEHIILDCSLQVKWHLVTILAHDFLAQTHGLWEVVLKTESYEVLGVEGREDVLTRCEGRVATEF